MLLVNQTRDAEASRAIGRRCLIVGASSLVLLASACSNKDRVEAKHTTKPATSAELFLSPAQSEGLQYLAAYEKKLQASADAIARVKKAMETLLFDPTTAQYSGIKVGRSGAVCGKYNAKNRYGAYVGFKDFVMTSDGRIVTNDTSGDEVSGSNYYSTYVEACGTKAELAAYRNMTAFPSASTPINTGPVEQEPDQVLDAPPPQRRPVPADIPTA